jgi:hypothetical protein
MNDYLVSGIAPVSDEAAAALVSAQAFSELGEQITQTALQRPRVRHGRAAAALGAVVAAAAVVTAVLAGVTSGPRSVDSRSSRPALVFTTAAGYVNVVIRNPYADPPVYRAEFAAHHLRITLLMVPGSPSVVGTLVYGGGNGIGVLRQPGRCSDPGGGACPLGVRIPLGYHGSTQIAFARPARPGEHYDATGLATAPGEAMHGLRYLGRSVARVTAMLARRHVTVGGYRVTRPTTAGGVTTTAPARVPGDWRVLGADPWAPGQVLLWVSRSDAPLKVPPGASCLPSAHGPVCATPAPSAPAG